VRQLVEQRYADTMFYDETKESMISVERRHDVDHDTYQDVQPQFVQHLAELLTQHGCRHTFAGEGKDADATLVIDPSIISVDLESTRVGKDLGASRAFDLLNEEGITPQQWRTIGDSATDYAMADWLQRNGERVAHIDVAPVPQTQGRAYPVHIPAKGIHDEAGGAYVDWMARAVMGEEIDESAFAG
jgi:hypothetical protein